jgi:hypothetical protein
MACALLMFALMAFNRQDRALLGAFGAVQLLIAGGILAIVRGKPGKAQDRGYRQ